MTTVSIPAALRDHTAGQSTVSVNARTVADALQELSAQHPALRRHLYTDDGALRSYINVFVNEDEIRVLNGVATALSEGDTLLIVASIAGG
jgi:adenylyltransferase/sulfurtransferase